MAPGGITWHSRNILPTQGLCCKSLLPKQMRKSRFSNPPSPLKFRQVNLSFTALCCGGVCRRGERVGKITLSCNELPRFAGHIAEPAVRQNRARTDLFEVVEPLSLRDGRFGYFLAPFQRFQPFDGRFDPVVSLTLLQGQFLLER